MATSDEFNLALQCCRYIISGEGLPQIGSLSSTVDPSSFIETIRRHRVQGLVHKALTTSQVQLPPEIIGQTRADALEIARTNLLAAAESIALHDQFSRADLPIIFIKGLTLSSIAYGDPFLKMSADIDVLIDPHSLDQSAEILRSSGYQMTVSKLARAPKALAAWHSRRKESVWYNPDSKLTLELHTRLADNPGLIATIDAHSPTQQVAVGAGRYLPTLRDDELLPYLCVHGASSAWFRLKWITDFAALLKVVGSSRVERLCAESTHFAGRAPAQAILLADRLFSLGLERQFRGVGIGQPDRLLSDIAYRELLQAREPTDRFLGTAWIHLSQILLAPGGKFMISEIKRQAADVIFREG